MAKQLLLPPSPLTKQQKDPDNEAFRAMVVDKLRDIFKEEF